MSQKRYFVWLALLAIVVILNLPVSASRRVSSTAKDGIAPFQNVMSLVISNVRNYIRSFARANRALEEVRDKNLEIARLKTKIESLERLVREEEKLSSLLTFLRESEHDLVLCEVVARNGTAGWWQTLHLNRGAKAGIRSGLAVVTADGIVGKTVNVSERTADVLLITDPKCKVSCEFAESGGFGIMRGGGVDLSGKEKLDLLYNPAPGRMDYIDRDRVVKLHDEVITSGLGGIFPRGIMVGYVSGADVHRSELYRIAEVVPSADLAKLRYVFVVVETGAEKQDIDMEAGP
ncbi:MAG: rod shape-determining protein MreC [Verrucomicrobiota bacterium]